MMTAMTIYSKIETIGNVDSWSHNKSTNVERLSATFLIQHPTCFEAEAPAPKKKKKQHGGKLGILSLHARFASLIE